MIPAFRTFTERVVAAREAIRVHEHDEIELDLAALLRLKREDQGYLLELYDNPQARALVGWGADWVRSGLPQIVVTPRLAASLMATSMERVCADDICLPWKAFAIVLPPSLVSAPAPTTGALVSWTRVHVHGLSEGVAVYATDDRMRIWTTGPRPLAEFCDVESIQEQPSVGVPLESRDLRALSCIDRLILGVCAELSVPEARASIARQVRTAASSSAARAEPRVWTYMLKRDVTVDCRDAVKAYVAGDRSRATVQVLVRGHWKRQRFGVGRECTRWIAIEPYWRGPEDAPIAVRKHRLREAV